jgi:acetyl-CoA C-acetyltransferase
MAELDARTPILVGAGQLMQRCEDPADGEEPLELIAQAMQRAADDAGAPTLLERADSIRITQGLWDYTNPAGLLGERFGARGAQTALGPISGSTVQLMINDAALAIRRGDLDVVFVAGGEAEHTKRRRKRAGLDAGWTEQPDGKPDLGFEADKPMMTQEEVALRIARPVAAFSLFENAIRYARGETLDAHRERVSELWSGISAVAANNPYAWIREPRSAQAIRTATADNRMISWPYTKSMCSNMVVDQAASVVLCSVGTARSLGIAPDRWIFPVAATDATYSPFMSNRMDFHTCPAMGVAGRRALELAQIGIEDIDHLDLYSCFPAAVQMAMSELEVPADRTLSVTGGLGFAGGPFNSYVLHSTATMMEKLRAEPGRRGLVTSLGGLFSKHAFGIYASAPPERDFAHDNVDAELQRAPEREVGPAREGRAEVETYVIQYLKGEATDVVAAVLDADGRRSWVRSEEPGLVAFGSQNELCGRRVEIDAAGSFTLA